MKEAQQVVLFTELNEMTPYELGQILHSRSLTTEGTKIEMIQRIIRSEPTSQGVNEPQALALATGGPETEATLWMQALNAVILPQNEKGELQKDKVKKKRFKFTQRDGGTYVLNCPYVPAKSETIQMVIDKGWVVPLESQVELLIRMKDDLGQFICFFIRKRDSNSKWYTMVWVQKKVA